MTKNIYSVSRKVNVSGITLDENRALEIKLFDVTLTKVNTESNVPNVIFTQVEAEDSSQAEKIATSKFMNFISSIPFILKSGDNIIVNMPVNSEIHITDITTKQITSIQTITGRSSIAIGSNEVESRFANLNNKGFHLNEPILYYSNAFYTVSIFQKYLLYFKVLECYFSGREELMKWIVDKEPEVEIVKDAYDKDTTIYQSIRHCIVHSKLSGKGQESLYETNSEHIDYVEDYLMEIQGLARFIISEKEKV